MDSHTVDTENLQATATQAVENELKIKGFIERHSAKILNELEKSAQDSDREVEFLADAFPIVASVVHAGSSRDDYMNALQWAKDTLVTADADSAITTLTFLYLVHRGLAERSGDSTKSDLWKTIKSRVDALLERDWGDEEEPAEDTRSPEGDSVEG